MKQGRSANVRRTAILTVVAVVWTLIIAGGWTPRIDVDTGALAPFLHILLPLLLGALPVVNIVLAVRDARALEAGSLDATVVLRWVITLLAVVINLFLIGFAFLMGAMLVNGPIAG